MGLAGLVAHRVGIRQECVGLAGVEVDVAGTALGGGLAVGAVGIDIGVLAVTASVTMLSPACSSRVVSPRPVQPTNSSNNVEMTRVRVLCIYLLRFQ